MATALRQFEPSSQTERFIARQRRLLVRAGKRGRRGLADVRAYLAGVNAYNRKAGNEVRPWTEVDVISVTGLLGQTFGAGGGGEVRSSLLLAELRNRLGTAGDAVWRPALGERLESLRDHAPPLPVRHRNRGRRPGSLVVDPGSLSASAARAARVMQRGPARASNAVLVGRGRSATGHPLAVMGPQLGYFYPSSSSRWTPTAAVSTCAAAPCRACRTC